MPQGSPSTKTAARPILESPVDTSININLYQKEKENEENRAPAQKKIALTKQKIGSNHDHTTTKSKIPAMSKKSELAEFVSSAREKGFTPSKLAKLCYQIDSLEKKHGISYEELKTKFEELRKSFEAKSKELRKLDAEIAALTKRKNDLLEQYYLDEKQVKEYVDARENLLSIGFDIEKLQNVKNSLLALKKEDFDTKAILEKINTIGDLESRKNALQKDLNALNGELKAKSALLVEVNKLQDSGLSVEQIEHVRDAISRISSTHGINADQSFEKFEQDILKHYNTVLGLEAELALLQESKEAINRENELKRKSLEQAEKEIAHKTKKLEESYAAQKAELKAFSELRANGVDSSTLLAWQELIRSGKVNPEILVSEIQKVGNLSSLEEEAKSKLKELEEREKSLEASIAELNQKKEAIELSIGTVKDSSIAQIEQTSSKALSSIADITKEVTQATENAKHELSSTLEQLKSSASLFSSELKDSLKDVGPQMKSIGKAVEAARALGKYEAILPLFKLTDSPQSNKITETEALVAMWNITNAFNSWIKSHYPNEELEISEPLERMIQALDGEIQGLGREEEEEEETEGQTVAEGEVSNNKSDNNDNDDDDDDESEE
jgi:cell division protein FtsB